jgi:hypothetical protein
MADGLAQGVHPEFKPWVPQKKKRRNYEHVCKTSSIKPSLYVLSGVLEKEDKESA